MLIRRVFQERLPRNRLRIFCLLHFQAQKSVVFQHFSAVVSAKVKNYHTRKRGCAPELLALGVSSLLRYSIIWRFAEKPLWISG